MLINLSTNVSMSWDKQHDDYGLVGTLLRITWEPHSRCDWVPRATASFTIPPSLSSLVLFRPPLQVGDQ